MTGVVDVGRQLVAVRGRERLPLDRQRPVALQVAERPVVAEHVEAVPRALERASWLVTAVPPVADRRGEHRRALVVAHPARELQEPVVGEPARRVQRGGHDLDLALGVRVGQGDLVARADVDAGRELRGDVRERLAPLGQVARPGDAALLDVDPLQERRDHRPQLRQHQVAVLAHLLERVRPQAQ